MGQWIWALLQLFSGDDNVKHFISNCRGENHLKNTVRGLLKLRSLVEIFFFLSSGQILAVFHYFNAAATDISEIKKSFEFFDNIFKTIEIF